MSRDRTVFAEGNVPFGARVLVRGMRARVAGPELANARAGPRPRWPRDPKHFRNGQPLSVTMDEGLGERDLKAIANGPIMDPSLLYLPAGKLSMADARAREAAQIIRDADA